jgi:hypothetical protein
MIRKQYEVDTRLKRAVLRVEDGGCHQAVGMTNPAIAITWAEYSVVDFRGPGYRSLLIKSYIR